MLRYDWKKINKVAKGKPSKVYDIFSMLVNKRVPYNKFEQSYYYSLKDFNGFSFLRNPYDLLQYSYKHSYKDLYFYFYLASLRPYALYDLFGETTLDTICIPTYMPHREACLPVNNSLLHIKEDKLYFQYEEVTGET